MNFKKQRNKIVSNLMAVAILSTSMVSVGMNSYADDVEVIQSIPQINAEQSVVENTNEDADNKDEQIELKTDNNSENDDKDNQNGDLINQNNSEELSDISVENNDSAAKVANNKNGIIKENGKYYYYKNGVKKRGWVTLGGHQYYFLNDFTWARGIWRTINGKRYYFNPNGVMAQNGKFIVDGRLRSFNEKGQIGSPTYNVANRAYRDISQLPWMGTAMVKKNGVGWYFYKEGTRCSGWVQFQGDFYYFMNNGLMAQNRWRTISGKRYYFKEDGSRAQNEMFAVNGIAYKFNEKGVATIDETNKTASQQKAAKAVDVAMSKLGKPYVWGATGPYSFDCSGLMLYSYRNGAGVNLPRVSRQQATAGKYVSRANLQPGDLVFWGSPVHHVGMYIGNGKYIHAPQPGDVVRISTLGSYTTARRILN